MLGISSGAAFSVAYAARHPERVSRLILYGGYARGWAQRSDSEGVRQYRAMLELMRVGWGKENPVFRQVFTSRFIPGASEAQIGWFNELCRRTSTGEMAARTLEARSTVDVSSLLGEIKAPTLVIHSRDDEVCPVSEARHLAAGIPGAQFVELDSRNHILLEDEPAWARFQEVVLDFMGLAAPRGEDPAFARLTAREREVLVADHPGARATPTSARASRSARRPSATTSRICSTSSACGRGRRRSSSRGTAVSGPSFRSGVSSTAPWRRPRASPAPCWSAHSRSGRNWDAPARRRGTSSGRRDGCSA